MIALSCMKTRSGLSHGSDETTCEPIIGGGGEMVRINTAIACQVLDLQGLAKTPVRLAAQAGTVLAKERL
jgi:hypothetical protein